MSLINFLTHVMLCNQTSNTSVPTYCNNACTNLSDYPVWFSSKNCYINPSVMSRTPALINQNGYEVEIYNITTPDGYILTLFRIPPRENDNRTNKQPIFLQHGLGSDSATWVTIGNRSLAFRLSALGYDVWLGNTRGSRYSRKHINLKSSDYEFWNYNLDNLALNDTRSSLKEVADKTGKGGSIIYIGHSLGTTVILMYASRHVQEASKLLKGLVLLSPVVYLDASIYVRLLLKAFPAINKILKLFKISSLFYHMEETIAFLQWYCRLFPYVCTLIISSDFEKLNQFLPEELLLFYSNFPSTISLTEIEHYAQLYSSGKFQMFDFGKKSNLDKYGQEEPPTYKLSNITLPTFIFYGKQDSFITKASMERLLGELGSTKKELRSVPIDNDNVEYQFSHFDFTFSKYLENFLYKGLVQILANELPSKT